VAVAKINLATQSKKERSLTKKHFEALAESIRHINLLFLVDDETEAEIRKIFAEEIGVTIQQFNENFNKDRFVKAATEPLK
jgi:hypothetical protein